MILAKRPRSDNLNIHHEVLLYFPNSKLCLLFYRLCLLHLMIIIGRFVPFCHRSGGESRAFKVPLKFNYSTPFSVNYKLMNLVNERVTKTACNALPEAREDSATLRQILVLCRHQEPFSIFIARIRRSFKSYLTASMVQW